MLKSKGTTSHRSGSSQLTTMATAASVSKQKMVRLTQSSSDEEDNYHKLLNSNSVIPTKEANHFAVPLSNSNSRRASILGQHQDDDRRRRKDSDDGIQKAGIKSQAPEHPNAPRHDKFRFQKALLGGCTTMTTTMQVATNDKCYCYVCNEPAQSCNHWREHCHHAPTTTDKKVKRALTQTIVSASAGYHKTFELQPSKFCNSGYVDDMVFAVRYVYSERLLPAMKSVAWFLRLLSCPLLPVPTTNGQLLIFASRSHVTELAKVLPLAVDETGAKLELEGWRVEDYYNSLFPDMFFARAQQQLDLANALAPVSWCRVSGTGGVADGWYRRFYGHGKSNLKCGPLSVCFRMVGNGAIDFVLLKEDGKNWKISQLVGPRMEGIADYWEHPESRHLTLLPPSTSGWDRKYNLIPRGIPRVEHFATSTSCGMV